MKLELAKELFESGNENFKALALEHYNEEELTYKFREGYYVSGVGEVLFSDKNDVYNKHRVLYKTKAQAEASIAQAELTQKMAEVNGDWEPDYTSSRNRKFTIDFYREKAEIRTCYSYRKFLVFPTKEIARKFIKDNYDLIMKYKPLT